MGGAHTGRALPKKAPEETLLNSAEQQQQPLPESDSTQVSFIKRHLSALSEGIELKFQIGKEELDLQRTDNELQSESQKYYEYILKREELEIQLSQVQLEDEVQITDIQQQVHQLKMNEEEQKLIVESLQEKSKYLSEKMKDKETQLKNYDSQRIMKTLIFHESLSSVQNYQVMAKLVLDGYMEALEEQKNTQQKISQQSIESELLKAQVDQLQNQLRINQIDFQQQIDQLKAEYQNMSDISNMNNVSQIKVGDELYGESETEQDKLEQEQFMKKKKKNNNSSKKPHNRNSSIGS